MTVLTFTDYEQALSAAESANLRVGGTYRGREPVYFLHPPDPSDDEMTELAFEAKHGRKPTEWDQALKAYMDAFAEAKP